jgi:hypothetical protein
VKEINSNLERLGGSLDNSKTGFSKTLRRLLDDHSINANKLSWCDPLASQVLSNEDLLLYGSDEEAVEFMVRDNVLQLTY